MRASIARSIGAPDVSGIDELLDAAARLGIRDFAMQSEHGRTVLRGVARYQLDREQLYEAIKRLDGWAKDIVVDVDVERQDVRGYYTVCDGDTLATIAQRYLGKASRELEILEANRDRMNDPDQICTGQQLLIPWR